MSHRAGNVTDDAGEFLPPGLNWLILPLTTEVNATTLLSNYTHYLPREPPDGRSFGFWIESWFDFLADGTELHSTVKYTYKTDATVQTIKIQKKKKQYYHTVMPLSLHQCAAKQPAVLILRVFPFVFIISCH